MSGMLKLSASLLPRGLPGAATLVRNGNLCAMLGTVTQNRDRSYCDFARFTFPPCRSTIFIFFSTIKKDDYAMPFISAPATLGTEFYEIRPVLVHLAQNLALPARPRAILKEKKNIRLGIPVVRCFIRVGQDPRG